MWLHNLLSLRPINQTNIGPSRGEEGYMLYVVCASVRVCQYYGTALDGFLLSFHPWFQVHAPRIPNNMCACWHSWRIVWCLRTCVCAYLCALHMWMHMRRATHVRDVCNMRHTRRVKITHGMMRMACSVWNNSARNSQRPGAQSAICVRRLVGCSGCSAMSEKAIDIVIIYRKFTANLWNGTCIISAIALFYISTFAQLFLLTFAIGCTPMKLVGCQQIFYEMRIL